ncbi:MULTISPECIES: recombination mediator RecR [unclassified Imperialibacter]|uniref:recombination mediator RecR n=1 Tax=unclassified Imperialibacter TaxID=2629706 RepID=UPI00125AEF93|nr:MULTISPECIES: recombination mediator RecR [unclassified Imperialibacter]CAD5271008.1 Recombination protein RecR [Imperialibacter sp. 75]CAD5298616.1 Recombination protein RecR [Imperialibacter sp. 89]VVT35661.1 Recombination protein RecR [Imperialibacter sp. EC-SDR9]
MEFPSKLIEEAVEQFSQFPGIGKKTALRLVLYLLKQEKEQTTSFTEALNNLRQKIRYCVECHNISDTEVCSICTSHRRDRSLICVVEDIHDVLAIENTSQYNGLYHVLGGIISPMNGVGPDELNIQTLVDRIAGKDGEVQEVILALSATMEGDTTSFYITRKVSDKGVKVSTIARGIPFGGELEYTDEITLGRSILTRVNYDLPAS